MKTTYSRLISTAVLGAFLITASAAVNPSLAGPGPEINATTTGLALRGYDPVSYFTGDSPKPGLYSITAEHNGATYRFSTEANKATFEADPAAYAPQYGGFCAFGAAMGMKFDGDPLVYRVENDKLYLNLGPDIAKRWNADRAELIADADEKWPAIRHAEPEDLN